MSGAGILLGLALTLALARLLSGLLFEVESLDPVVYLIALVIMLAMLYIFFREIRGVLLPFTVVILSILFAMGLIPLLGWQMSIITLLLPSPTITVSI